MVLHLFSVCCWDYTETNLARIAVDVLLLLPGGFSCFNAEERKNTRKASSVLFLATFSLVKSVETDRCSIDESVDEHNEIVPGQSYRLILFYSINTVDTPSDTLLLLLSVRFLNNLTGF